MASWKLTFGLLIKTERASPLKKYFPKSLKTSVRFKFTIVGEKINFRVDVVTAKDLPPHFCRDVYVEYSFYREDDKHATIVNPGKNRNPIFNFSELHRDCVITEELLDYLLKSTLCFKVYGLRDQKVKRKKQPAKREAYEAQEGRDEKPRKAAVADETPPIINY